MQYTKKDIHTKKNKNKKQKSPKQFTAQVMIACCARSRFLISKNLNDQTSQKSEFKLVQKGFWTIEGCCCTSWK